MSEWKNSPVIAVVVSGATVLTTTLFVIFNYALPVYQKDDLNKITDLKNKVILKDAVINERKKEVLDLNLKLNQEKEKSEKLRTELDFISLGTLFQKGSPFPIGYSAIEPGMTRENVYRYYGTPRVLSNEGGTFLSVKINAGGIDDIIYYFSRVNKNIISHIYINKEQAYYSSMDDVKRTMLKNLSFKKLLLNNLGDIVPCNHRYYVWRMRDKSYDVYFSELDDDSYAVFSHNIYPSGFDEQCIAN